MLVRVIQFQVVLSNDYTNNTVKENSDILFLASFIIYKIYHCNFTKLKFTEFSPFHLLSQNNN